MNLVTVTGESTIVNDLRRLSRRLPVKVAFVAHVQGGNNTP